MTDVHIIDTNAGNILEHGICGYKSLKRPGFPQKVEWLKARIDEGLKVRTLYSEKDGAQGMIEYIPGEFCWRPVAAAGYTFIHCLFVGFKKHYKGRGYASRLIDECCRDASSSGRRGVAVVTRKGPFMVGKEIFTKPGFEVVDHAAPDFELLIKRFDRRGAIPRFNHGWEQRRKQYGRGLTVIRADQCPYTVKNVDEIRLSAVGEFQLQPRVITLSNHLEAQNSPGPFGTFAILYDGELIAEHPISRTRFRNIMDRVIHGQC